MPGLASHFELDPRGARLGRRHRLGNRGGRGADEPAGGEHVERPGALADEVRRRLEAGLPADAAARHEGDRPVAQEPGDRLGRVSRVRVLGQQADERAFEPQVEGREQQRKRRLGDASAGRQSLRERAEPLAFGWN